MENEFNDILEGFEDSLFGIGATRKMVVQKLQAAGAPTDNRTVKAVMEASAKRAQQMMAPLNKSQRLLLAKAPELDTDTQNKLKQGKLQIQDGDLYIRKDISGASGVTDLLLPSTQYARGVSSFQSNKLYDNINLMVDRISLAYGTGATGTAVAGVRYSNDGQRIPAALATAEFVFILDDKPVMVTRCSRFFSDGTTTMVPTQRADNFAMPLSAPKLLKSGAALSLQIRFAEGQSLSTAVAHLIEVSLMGAITGTRTTD